MYVQHSKCQHYRMFRAVLVVGSVSVEREVGEVGGVTRGVLCTWQLLCLAVKGQWLA